MQNNIVFPTQDPTNDWTRSKVVSPNDAEITNAENKIALKYSVIPVNL